jgi:hypothetical protein
MEQAKEKVLIFIFFWFFPCFVKSSSSIPIGKEDLKKIQRIS